ncbi:MAG TPA: presenilin family intramembrane aspartyl protease [Alphaproteobacteria bacterium]|nr:presenilin family intramembrane aspartyl protease [Alphaproteobacteria bacterium]
MKHNWTITSLLVLFFVLAQFTGLALLNKESEVAINPQTQETVISYNSTAIGDRPETSGAGSLIYIIIAIAIGTILVLFIARYGKTNIWRTWFFLAVWMALCVSLGVMIKENVYLPYDIAIILALILTSWKLFRPNIYIHNLTEILMYSGIGLIIVPLFDVKWALALLILISIYDMYAVWKSKHMITLAKFQSQSNMFAGLMIPYKTSGKNQKVEILSASELRESSLKSHTSNKSSSESEKLVNTTPKIRAGKTAPQNAILGGGDIVFPLVFIGTVMNDMILRLAKLNPLMSIEAIKSAAFLESSIIVVTATISLTLLFIFAKKGRFYPAMPFLSAGCLIGWAITLII